MTEIATAAEPSSPADSPFVQLNIIFAADGGPDNLRFVEVENFAGASVNAGTWIDRLDGLKALSLTVHKSDLRTDAHTAAEVATDWISQLALDIAEAVMGNPIVEVTFVTDDEQDGFKSDIQIEAARVLRRIASKAHANTMARPAGRLGPFNIADGAHEANARAEAGLAAMTKDATDVVLGLLRHSCVADAHASDKDAEDHDAERAARAFIARALAAGEK